MAKNHFVRYEDLLTIEDYDKQTDKEEFIFLPLEDDYVIGIYQAKRNMLEYGHQIAVRKSVYQKLINVAKKLKNINNDYKIIVVYGFRDMKKQEKYFNEILEQVKNKFDDKLEMFEYIHEKIAVPSVSGHPTGGAVDAAIYDARKKEIIDFGSEILDFNTINCYYQADDITEVAKNNRKLLRKMMMNEGFAPYDGEWWHFSYGDKEWAFYYDKEKALYNQVDANKIFEK